MIQISQEFSLIIALPALIPLISFADPKKGRSGSRDRYPPLTGCAGRSGGCKNGVFINLISAGMCLRHIQGHTRIARAPDYPQLTQKLKIS